MNHTINIGAAESPPPTFAADSVQSATAEETAEGIPLQQGRILQRIPGGVGEGEGRCVLGLFPKVQNV